MIAIANTRAAVLTVAEVATIKPMKTPSLRPCWRVQAAAGRNRLAHGMLAPPRTAAIKVMHKGG
jgi:hypothetical protein